MALGALAALGIGLWLLSGREICRENGVVLDLGLRDTGRVSLTAENDRRLKLRLTLEGGAEYTYDLPGDGTEAVFPLSQGPGEYTAQVFENTTGDRYRSILRRQFRAQFPEDEPFLRPSRMVKYTEGSACAALAADLAGGLSGEAEQIDAVLSYVAGALTYDDELARTAQSGYLPDPDAALAAGKGICQDYAALMAAMLRSLGIPCQMAVGHLPTGEYHAWVRAWSETGGRLPTWGLTLTAGAWTDLDPTFLSQDPALAAYVADSDNYRAEYVY